MSEAHLRNEFMGKILIAFILLLIIFVILIKDESTVEIDEKNKTIIAHIKTRFKNETHKYSYASVKSIYIRKVGKNVMAKYLVKISLKNKKKLKVGEFFDSYDQAVTFAEKLHSTLGGNVILHKNPLTFIFNWL